jgi:ribosomal-protein-alanine N-acetyltransferase
LGLGELLLLSLLDQSIGLGAYVATLEVRVSNSTAIALYHKYGFEIVSRRKRYYTDNNEDAYIMTTAPLETAQSQTNLDGCRRQLYDRLANRQASSTAQNPAPGLAPGGHAVPTREPRAG